MSYEPSPFRKSNKQTSCAFFTFTGTPSTNNPLTPVLVGSSSNFSVSVSSNNIQLPAGEYIMRFYGAITRTAADRNIVYQWRKVGGPLIGVEGSTNRELFPGTMYISVDSADAHLLTYGSSQVQVEITTAESGVTLDTDNSHAIIWRVG